MSIHAKQPRPQRFRLCGTVPTSYKDCQHDTMYIRSIVKNHPVLTTHGNPPVATGGGKLDYMEAFPSVATGGPPMDHRWKIRKFRKRKFRSKFLETEFTTRNTFRRIKAKQNGKIIRTGSEFSVNPVCSFRSCPKNIFHWLSSDFRSYSSDFFG